MTFKKTKIQLGLTLLLALGLLTGCSSPADELKDAGTLVFTANGEDFVRNGMISKDGWEISFDHVYVTLSDITGYQTDPPYDPDESDTITSDVKASINEVITVDLAEGDENASPIYISEVAALPGHYNGLSWNQVKAPEGTHKGYSLVIIGNAKKDDTSLPFQLNFDKEYGYKAGEYLGDTRKGFVKTDDSSNVEITMHFDHLFGDGNSPADDGLNVHALGFDPIFKLAEDGRIELDYNTLASAITEDELMKLNKILSSFGHVGEGHSRSEEIKK